MKKENSDGDTSFSVPQVVGRITNPALIRQVKDWQRNYYRGLAKEAKAHPERKLNAKKAVEVLSSR